MQTLLRHIVLLMLLAVGMTQGVASEPAPAAAVEAAVETSRQSTPISAWSTINDAHATTMAITQAELLVRTCGSRTVRPAQSLPTYSKPGKHTGKHTLNHVTKPKSPFSAARVLHSLPGTPFLSSCATAAAYYVYALRRILC